MRDIIVGFFCFLFGNLAFSQNSTELLKITQIKDSIFLISNESNRLPITDLKESKIAVLHLGNDSTQTFQQRIKDYSIADHYFLKHENDIQKFHNNVLSYNVVIVAYYQEGVYQSLLEYLNDWQDQMAIIHVVMQTSEFFNNNNQFDQSETVIHVNGSSSLHQDLAAQAVFGGITLKSRKQEVVAKNRLGFVIPEQLGLNSDSLEIKIDSVVYEGLMKKAFPGCQILVAKDGNVFFHKTYGYHTYDSVREVRKQNIYDLASVTKVTGATAGIMKLHDEGLFDLDAPAKTYWPQFKLSNKSNLTFRSILAHNARLKSWIPYWKSTIRKNGSYKWNTLSNQQSERFPIQLTEDLYLHKNYKKKIYWKIRKSNLNKKPGYVYSGLSFYLYPEIIERISGVEYESFLKSRFYEPLGANTLTFNAGKQYSLEEIIPTEIDTFFRKTQLHGVVHDEGAAMMDGISGNAGLFGTAIDLAKMWQMFLNMGEYGGKRYLSNQTVRKFTTCQYCEEGNRRGLGFDKPLIEYHPDKSSVAEGTSPESFGHSGYTGTFVWADPENNVLFIFLSNRVYPSRDNRLIYQLSIRPRIHSIIYDELEKAYQE